MVDELPLFIDNGCSVNQCPAIVKNTGFIFNFYIYTFDLGVYLVKWLKGKVKTIGLFLLSSFLIYD